MISFEKFTLDNGLKVIVHSDKSMPIVAFNILYNVGSKHEDPKRTGFAHLFEHLMFGGSVNVPNYDDPVEQAGGENNAFTSNDITNYYLTLPKENLETAFWIESDRMLGLAFSQKSLDVQKNVVIEEFNQSYLNQPYGDVWLLLRPLAYKVHPYQWPTIGKTPEHIANAKLSEVKEFFYGHYAPNNAILCVAGDVSADEVLQMAQKWFGPIPYRELFGKIIKKEPLQTEKRTLEVTRRVPYNSIYKAYHMCSRSHNDFSTVDLTSDILSNGKSSRLFQSLVKQKGIFSNIDAFITGDNDEGLFVITGRLNDNYTFLQAEEAIDAEVEMIKTEPISDYELNKVKNKFESNFTFGLTSANEKALNLCQYELLGDANLLNTVVDSYRMITNTDIQRVAKKIFATTNCSTLYYKADNTNQ
ncbi:MAG: pitrilysin family protein [Bacteroidales bacterium]|nr:pitrilysin family protein [Bacteroidales bacterium]MDD4384712.1 pitrilysin family protein [Bacteroidales bacterium]MDY0196206.1 pitrilysin family protein [Tenuifilaceae bacterium]